MDVGAGTLTAPGLEPLDVELPPIPAAGLREVLSAWSGRGNLLTALAAALDDEFAERRWTALDVRRRAHRILLAEVAPALRRWPRDANVWLDTIPAEAIHVRQRSPAVGAGVDWVSTMIHSGWPPLEFERRSRIRTADTLSLATLRWTLERLAGIEKDVLQVEPGVVTAVTPQLGVALALLEEEPLASVTGDRPSFEDLRAVAREGRPWNAVASVAKQLIAVDGSPEVWATRLVAPDRQMRPTLFHLGVLGTVLRAVSSLGGAVISRAPLSGAPTGPSYVLTVGGAEWDLWFEAGGVWSRYGRHSPYVEATSGLAELPIPLKPDLMLVRPGEAALILECKYSERIETVGRQGLTQALAYAVEARTRLAPVVEAYVVAPDGTMPNATKVSTTVGSVGIVMPADLEKVLSGFLA